jgi:hypothetical protein
MRTTYALPSINPPTQCGLATFAAALLAHLPRPGVSSLAAELAGASA